MASESKNNVYNCHKQENNGNDEKLKSVSKG